MRVLVPGKRPDWFLIDQASARDIAAAPGLTVARNTGYPWVMFDMHRSMLPLLDTDEAARLIGQCTPVSLIDTWEARDAATDPLGFKLKTVQHQAVDFIRARRGTLLGDEMRVGKTLSAAYSHDPNLGRLVVVCPLIARQVWIGWLRRIWPDTEIGVMVGKTFDPEAARKPIVVGHYDILFDWQSGDPIGTLILDEAHALVNHRSRRFNAASMLASRAERVVAATGTPVWNMPTGLWAILALIAPGAFGGYHEFCRRYAAPEPTAYGTVYTGLSNGDELALRLSEVMIRRRWVDVQADLPPITRNVEVLDLSMAERRKLDMETQRLRTSATTNTAAELARYRDALSRMKVPLAVAKAERFMQAGEPVVIWVWHRETADSIVAQLAAKGLDAMSMTGDSPQHRRERIMDQWKAMPNAALVVTMAVGQVGIDLSHSRLPIFAEIDYTPAMISQAEMRTFHPSRGMNVTYVVVDHYVDRKIVDALTRKLDASAPVDLSTGEGAIKTIGQAFSTPEDTGDMNRFTADLLDGLA